jgi:predicted dehydrogenase
MKRRDFLSATGSALLTQRASANDKVVIACMGIRGRAGHLLRGFAALPDVEIAMLCDVDSRLFEQGVRMVTSQGRPKPRVVTDFRRALDDKSIDALVVGTPDHWHAIPTILGCQAGKHVYVEKPCSHNVREGQVMVAAARRYKRVVQVGIQSRSGRHFDDALRFLKTGALGRVSMARGWETARQGAVPVKPDSDPPSGVDYDMWLGPAPKRAFNPNRFHGSWRWYFDYGTGDLGNDGVHRIDYARRGLAAAFEGQGRKLPDWPHTVSASGGKLFFDDSQEWPDTLLVTWEYPSALLTYEMRVWTPNAMEGEEEGAAIYGENGCVIIGNTGWRAVGPKGEQLHAGTKSDTDEHDPVHKKNFLACIRNGGLPNCDIGIGHVASSLTHLGNIAWRVDRKLRWNAHSESFVQDDEANRLLSRSYRAPWTLPNIT